MGTKTKYEPLKAGQLNKFVEKLALQNLRYDGGIRMLVC